MTGSQEVGGSNPPSSTTMDDRKNPCLLIDCSIRRQGYFVCYEHIRTCDAYFIHETAYESFLFRQGTLRKQASHFDILHSIILIFQLGAGSALAAVVIHNLPQSKGSPLH